MYNSDSGDQKDPPTKEIHLQFTSEEFPPGNTKVHDVIRQPGK